MNFSAVILAGGKSSRMGHDKAWLTVGGQRLLARQIEIARAAGAIEIFISGRAGVDYSTFGCPVLKDQFADAGPLAGIERALAVCTKSPLLVLAVDMPAMRPELLRRLAVDCTEACGVIPRIPDGREPLAAFYPLKAHGLLIELLTGARSLTPPFSRGKRAHGCSPAGKSTADSNGGRMVQAADAQSLSPLPGGAGLGEGGRGSGKAPSVKQFAELCVQSGLARYVELTKAEACCFTNWNSPADLPCTT